MYFFTARCMRSSAATSGALSSSDFGVSEGGSASTHAQVDPGQHEQQPQQPMNVMGQQHLVRSARL